jgi:hypothetical protein
VSRTFFLCTCCRHHAGPAPGRFRSATRRWQPVAKRVVGSACASPFSRRSLALRVWTLAVSPIGDRFYEGFSSCVLTFTGWGLAPHWKAPPCHGAYPKRASLCQSWLFTEHLSPPLRACQFHPECCCLLPCRRQRALQFAGDNACLRFLSRHGLQRLDVFPGPGARRLCCWALHFREFLCWSWLVTASRPTSSIVWNEPRPPARPNRYHLCWAVMASITSLTFRRSAKASRWAHGVSSTQRWRLRGDLVSDD